MYQDTNQHSEDDRRRADPDGEIRLRGLDGLDVQVIGEGCLGEKAEQLIEKTPKLRELGYLTPRRICLAQSFLDEFVRHNGLGATISDLSALDRPKARIFAAKFSNEQLDVIESIVSSLGRGTPVGVRSSAKGDARGTGIYHSEFTDCSKKSIVRAIKLDLASYASPSAAAFRRDASTGEGFGLLVEPIIGQETEYGSYAPVLSGMGYTSTSRGGCFIRVEPGLAGGVDSREADRITKEYLEEILRAPRGGPLLSDYMRYEYDAMYGTFPSKPPRESALLQRTRGWFSSDAFSGKAYSPPNRHNKFGEVLESSLCFPDEVIMAFRDLDLKDFLDRIEQMERLFGEPQYFEWALTVSGDELGCWITQIDGVRTRPDVLDFGDLGERIFEGHTVTGTGDRECMKIVECWNPEDIDRLHEFNKHNTDYVLVYSSRLVSRRYGARQFVYADYSNAAVAIEIQDASHAGDPISHLDGRFAMAKKFFAVLSYDRGCEPEFDALNSKEHALLVYPGRVRVVASERQNRLIVAKGA